MIRPTGASHAPERFSALRPPLDSGERSKVANPGRKNAPRERDGLFDIVSWDSNERFSDEPHFRTRSPVLILRSARAAFWPNEANVPPSGRPREGHPATPASRGPRKRGPMITAGGYG